MTILDCIKKGFSIVVKSRNLIVLLFSFSFVWSLINIPLTPLFNPQGGQYPISLSVSVVILSLFYFLTGMFIKSGSLGFVHQMIKQGDAKIGEFKALAFRAYFRILGVSIIVALFLFILLVLVALTALLMSGALRASGILFIAAVVVVGAFAVSLVSLAPYIVVADDKKVIEALKESKEIVLKGLTLFTGFTYFVLLALITVTVIPMIIFLAFYYFNVSFRESAFCRLNLVKIYVLGLTLNAIWFLANAAMNGIMQLLGLVLKGVAAEILVGFLSSILNAYIGVLGIVGVVVAGSFMTYYLSLKQESAPSAP